MTAMCEDDLPLTLCKKPRSVDDFIEDIGSKDKVLPLEVQEGGDHYKRYAIQPVEFAMSNRLDLCQANVVKYTLRCRDKGGIEDIKKAIHYLQLMAHFYYDEVV